MPQRQEIDTSRTRHYLEPGPVLLVSSRHEDETDIMTLGWHMVMAFQPALVACLISSGNNSYDLIRQSGECVLNLPTSDLADTVCGIGNSTGIDKFAEFGLTAEKSQAVAALSIADCHASFECRLYDDTLVDAHDLFIFEVVSARAASEPEYPEYMHYTGEGIFRLTGGVMDKHHLFTKVA